MVMDSSESAAVNILHQYQIIFLFVLSFDVYY